MSGYAWAAGNYTTTPTYTVVNSLGGSASFPGQLIVSIPAFISVPGTLPTFALNVNSLTYYSSAMPAVTANMAVSSTVSYRIGVNANNSNFTYSSTLGLSTPANLSVGGVSAFLNSGAALALSSSSQNLNSTAIAVSAGNNQTQVPAFQITPANLKSQFVQAGTYTVPLTVTTSDASSSPTVPNQTTTSMLTVTVADMQAITVNDASATLTFSATTDYQAGVSQAQPNHLTVSSTTPWTLSVKAASSTLSNGTVTLPANMVTVGNTTGQTILNTTALSTTAQTITTASQAAAIAKVIGVLYAISAANAAGLINKATKSNDTYTTTLTYTLTGL